MKNRRNIFKLIKYCVGGELAGEKNYKFGRLKTEKKSRKRWITMSKINTVLCRNCNKECSNEYEFCPSCHFRLRVWNANLLYSESKLDQTKNKDFDNKGKSEIKKNSKNEVASESLILSIVFFVVMILCIGYYYVDLSRRALIVGPDFLLLGDILLTYGSLLLGSILLISAILAYLGITGPARATIYVINNYILKEEKNKRHTTMKEWKIMSFHFENYNTKFKYYFQVFYFEDWIFKLLKIPRIKQVEKSENHLFQSCINKFLNIFKWL